MSTEAAPYQTPLAHLRSDTDALMSHAALRESFSTTSGGGAAWLAANSSVDGARPPSLGTSPHSHRREAAVLRGDASPDAAAAAIQQHAKAVEERGMAVEAIAKGAQVGGGSPHVRGLTTPLSVAEKNGSFSGVGHALGTTPPPLHPLQRASPHGERRESAASQPPSARGTPASLHGILPLPASATAAAAPSFGASTPFHTHGATGRGFPAPVGNGSFGRAATRLGVSPIAEMHALPTRNLSPAPFAAPPGSGTHVEVREGTGEVSLNVSFATTPHTALREGGAILAEVRDVGDYAPNPHVGRPHINPCTGAADAMHTQLRESVSSTGPAATGAAAVVAAMESARAALAEQSAAVPQMGGGEGATASAAAPTHTDLRESFATSPQTSPVGFGGGGGGRPMLSAPARATRHASHLSGSPADAAERGASLSGSFHQTHRMALGSSASGGSPVMMAANSMSVSLSSTGAAPNTTAPRVSPHMQRRELAASATSWSARNAITGNRTGLASSLTAQPPSPALPPNAHHHQPPPQPSQLPQSSSATGEDAAAVPSATEYAT